MENMEDMEELLSRYKDLVQQIDELNERAQEIKIRIFEIKWGVKVGDRITYENREGIVCRLANHWIRMNPIKKDGTVSRQQVHCYDFPAKVPIKYL
jgi:hypothetical protein